MLSEQLSKEHIYPKYIQISRNASLSDLKNKLLRITNNVLKELKNTTEITELSNIRIYQPHKLSKKDLFELVFAYTNKSKNYTVFGQELGDDSIKIYVIVF